MIRLALMKEWFDAVDEEWRSPIADQIAAPTLVSTMGGFRDGFEQHPVSRYLS